MHSMYISKIFIALIIKKSTESYVLICISCCYCLTLVVSVSDYTITCTALSVLNKCYCSCFIKTVCCLT